MLHYKRARPAENRMLDGKRSANRQTGIARRRLDVNALEWCVFKHLAVRNAIESHAASEAQGFLLCARRQFVYIFEQNFLEPRLHTRGQVAMPLFDRLFGPSGWAQQFLELIRVQPSEHGRGACIAPSHLRPLPLMGEII